MRYVVDSSVALRWVLTEEDHPNARRVLERLLERPELFAVPELFAFEVLAVLWRLHPQPDAAFAEAILPVLNGGLLRYPMTGGLAERVFSLGGTGLTGYDACYAGLALELDACWLTFDRKAHRMLSPAVRAADLWDSLPTDWEKEGA